MSVFLHQSHSPKLHPGPLPRFLPEDFTCIFITFPFLQNQISIPFEQYMHKVARVKTPRHLPPPKHHFFYFLCSRTPSEDCPNSWALLAFLQVSSESSLIACPSPLLAWTTLIKVPDALIDPVDKFPFLTHQHLITPFALKHLSLGSPVPLLEHRCCFLVFPWDPSDFLAFQHGHTLGPVLRHLLSVCGLSLRHLFCLRALNIFYVLQTSKPRPPTWTSPVNSRLINISYKPPNPAWLWHVSLAS